MALDYNKLLYERLSQEHDDFVADLKTKTPEQIIEASYEKVIKDDLLSIFEYTEFPQCEAKALYKLGKPLDALYAVRELKAQSRDSR